MVSDNGVWRALPFMTANAVENMAIDEAILEARLRNIVPNTVRFYRWNPSAVSIGRNQSLSLEVDMDAAKRLGIDVVRRISGGGAVYHDKDAEITYSVVVAEKDLRAIFRRLVGISENYGQKISLLGKSVKSGIKRIVPGRESTIGSDIKSGTRPSFDVNTSYYIITGGLVEGLKNFGIKVDEGIIHCPALFVNGKKISGNAQARRKGIILQHGTILLDVDPELMYTVLKPPSKVSRKKIVTSVRTKVTGILGKMDDFDVGNFTEKMLEGFERFLGIKIEKGGLTDFEKKMVEELKSKRYASPDWLNRIP